MPVRFRSGDDHAGQAGVPGEVRLTRRAGQSRTSVLCPECRIALAYIRPEWLILRRMLVTDAAVSHHRENGRVHLTCRCGQTVTMHWAMIQM